MPPNQSGVSPGFGAGTYQTPPAAPVSPLNSVLGFVTEFNANVQIFNGLALAIILTIAKIQGMDDTLQRLTSDAAGLKNRITLLEAGIRHQEDERRAGYSSTVRTAE